MFELQTWDAGTRPEYMWPSQSSKRRVEFGRAKLVEAVEMAAGVVVEEEEEEAGDVCLWCDRMQVQKK